MSYTKGELVSAALEEIGIASYDYDISPEQLDSGLRRLDSMMGDWISRGILVSFPIAQRENSNSGDDSNLPSSAWEAVITNLAIRLAPSYGRAVSVETRGIAVRSYNDLLSLFATPRERQMNSMPKGAGYKATENRYTPVPVEQYVKNVDETIDLSGEPV